MQLHRDMLFPSRVLHEDDDFLTLEVGKHDDVKFTLRKDESGETVGGDRFLTVLFIRFEDGAGEVWKPWGEDDADE